jgi:hypothetical protein
MWLAIALKAKVSAGDIAYEARQASKSVKTMVSCPCRELSPDKLVRNQSMRQY